MFKHYNDTLCLQPVSNGRKKYCCGLFILIVLLLSFIYTYQYFTWRAFLTGIPYHYEDINVKAWQWTLTSHNLTTGNLNDTYNGTKLQVPNIVHYVWLGDDLLFTFLHYVSFLSVQKFIKPSKILVYANGGPLGFWWNKTRSEVTNIYLVKGNFPDRAPNGHPYRYPAHASDFIRVVALLETGGIYLDADVFILKSFDPLRIYSTVMGREGPAALCNGIIVSSPGAAFLRFLLDQYYSYNYKTEEWSEKSVWAPDRLARRHRGIIHVEETSFNRPNYQETEKIYHQRYNWSQNYAMHLWFRMVPKELLPKNHSDVNCLNTTLGEISRYILYGSSELKCPSI